MADEPRVGIHDPENVERISELYVFLSIDEEGRNGIVATMMHGLGSTPLITARPRLAEVMKATALALAKKTSKRIGLYRFDRGELLWESSRDQGGGDDG